MLITQRPTKMGAAGAQETLFRAAEKCPPNPCFLADLEPKGEGGLSPPYWNEN